MRILLGFLPSFLACQLHAAEPLDFTVKLETVMKHDDGKTL